MGNSFKEVDGIIVYHSDSSEKYADYNPKGLINLYNSERKHFWFLYRNQYIHNAISHYTSLNDNFIEIGAGTGNVSRYLISKGFKNISVGEMHISGLRYAKTYGINKCYQFDLMDSPFNNEFDSVGLFDVLEHIEDSNRALKNVHKMLSKNGYVFLTLPAHNWLWSREDAIAGHKKRYTREEIIKELMQNGFEPISVRYFFIFIVPLLLLRRFINPDHGGNVLESEYSDEIKVNSVVNKVLFALCRIEGYFEKIIPNFFGGSLFVVGKKK